MAGRGGAAGASADPPADVDGAGVPLITVDDDGKFNVREEGIAYVRHPLWLPPVTSSRRRC
jgi:hypothetical protein